MIRPKVLEIDVTSINKTMTESKQTKTQAFFCGGSEKSHFRWLHSTCCLKILLNFTYEEGFTVFFYKFLILLGNRWRSQRMRGFKITTVESCMTSQTLTFSNLPITGNKSICFPLFSRTLKFQLPQISRRSIRFFQPIFVCLGGLRNRDSTVILEW